LKGEFFYTMTFEQILHKITPRRLFLIDSLGALLTALMLGLVLSSFVPVFGMPRAVLYPLSLIAVGFAVYSFFCYRRFPTNWPPFLRGIAVANLFYCCLTLGLVFYYYEQLTVLGGLYFLGEIIIVVSLAVGELKTVKKYLSDEEE